MRALASLLVALLVAGCAAEIDSPSGGNAAQRIPPAAPPVEPAPATPEIVTPSTPPATSAPGSPPETAARQTLSVPALHARALERVEAARTDFGLEDDARLYSIESRWFPGGFHAGDVLLPVELMPRELSLDIAAVRGWEFWFLVGDFMFVLLLDAEGNVLDEDGSHWGLDMGSMMTTLAHADMDPAPIEEALLNDERYAWLASAPLRDVAWHWSAIDDAGGWTFHVYTRTQGSIEGSWNSERGIHAEHKPDPDGLVIEEATALREGPGGGVDRIAYEVTLSPDAKPIRFHQYGALVTYHFPGPDRSIYLASRTPAAPGNYEVEWLKGDGSDQTLDPSDRVLLTLRLTGHELGPGQHVGLSLDDAGSHDLSVTLPDDFGDALEIPIDLGSR